MTQLLQNAVSGTALILAAALLRRGLKGRLLPGARLALWAVCLFRLLTPTAPESALSLWGLLPRTETAPVTAPVIDPLPLPSMGVGGNLPAPGIGPVEPAGAAFPWETALLAVWIGVGALLAVRCALSWNRTRRAVAQAIPLPRDDARYAALPKCARLREGVMDGAPLTFGAVRPTVVLSPGLSGETLDCVLAHEGVHAWRRDNLWHYAMGLALVLYWWNPAVWLMARLLRRDVELSCDRAAVKKLGADKRAQYAKALVDLATMADDPAFCQTFGRKAAEERIISIMKYKKMNVIGGALSLALVLVVTVGFASNPAEKKPSGDPAPANTSPLIVENGDPGVTPPRPVTLEEFEAMLKDQVSGGKLSQAETDGLLAGARKGMEGQECPYLWVVDGNASYAIMGGNICTLADCGNNSRHTHDGVWYTGWTGKTTIPLYCTDENCNLSGTHYHENGEVVHCYDTAPALLPVCTVEGCTIWGPHTHDGVAYRCNGGHCGGVCDGSCHNVGDGSGASPIACPPETIDQNFPSRTGCYPDESGHHSDSHHGNGYQGGHH